MQYLVWGIVVLVVWYLVGYFVNKRNVNVNEGDEHQECPYE